MTGRGQAGRERGGRDGRGAAAATGGLAEEVLRGSSQAVARLISLVEDRPAEAAPALRRLHPHTGRAYVVGITGPPGSGKSTLIDMAIRAIRRDGRRVGVVAVDPTSPFTGGAILGDRVRMQDHSTDPGVFVRSMATRGRLGGLAAAASGAIEVLDAYGCDLVLVETVGTGQAEVDIVGTADSVLVVVVPNLGDGVQTLKAGIMEIGDVFIVNKADRGDAARAMAEITTMLGLAPDRGGWRPPVLQTISTDGTGIPRLLEVIGEHRAYQEAHGLLAQRRLTRRRQEIVRLVEDNLRDRVLSRVGGARLQALAAEVAEGRLDPQGAADALVAEAGLR